MIERSNKPNLFTGHLHRCLKRCQGFTLIEVLVVVAIIALLMAILVPSLRNAREEAKTTICIAQIQQLMRCALMYKMDFAERLPGAGRNDADHQSMYDNGNRKDWLSWVGTWTVMIDQDDIDAGSPAWLNAPRGGRLWKYYKDEKILECPSAEKFNGKFSYSMPENVSLAMKDPSGDRAGLPPKMDKVKHPHDAILFLDEDEENGLSNYSMDDGFGEPDMFADRHLGRASVSFFDGHAAAYYFPRGQGSEDKKVRYPQNKSANPFQAWMIQIAPFNSKYTPRPWRWSGKYEDWPKFKYNSNYPANPCGRRVGCE